MSEETTGSFRLSFRDPAVFASIFHDLPELEGEERRIVFRRVFTELSREALEGPGPLEGIAPALLVSAARASLEAGLFDDLDWLAPDAVGRGLFTLASALPPGNEQRELGRRALSRLLVGNATTFAAIATVMARTGAKAFGSAPVTARTALLVELPLSFAVPDGALAFTLAVRKQLCRDWILGPSTRSLASRRLAARIIERAAREMAHRKDPLSASSIRFFLEEGPLQTAHQRLLEDRESLVWRHAAVARGLLAGQSEELAKEIATQLSPSLSPTEWRRAATSTSALAAIRPEIAVRLSRLLFASEVPERDPGVVGAFIWGLTRAGETEPEVATELFGLTEGGPAEDIAEGALHLRRDLGRTAFTEHVCQKALEALLNTHDPKVKDDGLAALRRELARDLAVGEKEDDPLRLQIERAMELFAADGAKAAHARGAAILSAALTAVDALEAVGQGAETSMSRRTSLAAVRDLDISLLERDVLVDLLRLDTNIDKVRAHEESLGALKTRVARFVLEREGATNLDGAGSPEPSHLVLHFSRLRALLHLVDSDAIPVGQTQSGDEASRLTERARWQMVSQAVLARIEARPSRALRRALLATLARSLDGLARTQACDVVDTLLVVSSKVSDARDFDALSEAAMDPDLRHVFSSYAVFLRAEEGASSGDSLFPDDGVEKKRTAALMALGEAMLGVGSLRSEALRSVLFRLGIALSTLGRATSLRATATANGDVELIGRLEVSAQALQQMCLGARARIFETMDRDARPPGGRVLTVAIARVLSGGDEEIDSDSLALASQQLTAGVPRAIGAIIEALISYLGELPHDGSVLPDAPEVEHPLPNWVPARRVLGAYYVLRPLSAGALGSVFIVCRTEDRRSSSAEKYALKVPDYSANAARHLSEAEFFNLFRAEAAALVGLPPHSNLAQLVTFDLGARPRPILVMEYVEGPTLERAIELRTLELPRCLELLDGVLAGLEVMHDAQVGHLDVKPANVVLRRGEQAVLVDFGLAGRHIRPGCATAEYGAPEIWGAVPAGCHPTPMAADVYAFGCLAFETLTGLQLFDGESEVALLANHIGHDGIPPRLRELSSPKLQPLVEFLFSCLRRDPRARGSARALRAEWKKVGRTIEGMSWPLQSK